MNPLFWLRDQRVLKVNVGLADMLVPAAQKDL
jgi:hypothetical protein